jgi:hypothetical protein
VFCELSGAPYSRLDRTGSLLLCPILPDSVTFVSTIQAIFLRGHPPSQKSKLKEHGTTLMWYKGLIEDWIRLIDTDRFRDLKEL